MGLDLVEVLIAIESEFGISVPEDDPAWPGVVTVGDLAGCLVRWIEAQRGSPPDPEAVRDRLVEIVAEQSSRPRRGTVTAESRLADVLSM